MNHDEAVGTSATERYLLHDLPDDERDAFEEHYFECALCADDVQAGSAFVGGLRALKDDPFVMKKIARARRNLNVPLAAAASIIMTVLTALTMQLGFVAPARRQVAQLRLPSTPVAHMFGQTRGEDQAILNQHLPNELDVPMDPDEEAPRYTWTILDGSGKPVLDPVIVGADRVKDLTLRVTIPAGALKPGEYKLHVVSKREADYPFTVR